MRQILVFRPRKRRDRAALGVLPLDPRDPDIVRAQALARAAARRARRRARS